MRSAFVGFDSAWGDRAKGGICTAIFDRGRLERFCTPEPASFDHATAIVEQCRRDADYSLVAIDQPTMVPNACGMRPVEKVAGALKTGVQPAYLRSKMWWPSAPIWTFLDELCPNEAPRRARSDTDGLHVIEVFPGLALPALVGALAHPTKSKDFRYNPKSSNFAAEDWNLVTSAVHIQTEQVGLAPFADWARPLCGLEGGRKPSKADQDCLDALICLIIARKWQRGDEDTHVLGDWRGHIVTPLSEEGRRKIEASAIKRCVPVGCGSWELHDATLGY
ncbi:MAG: DUF429 domain-containing protein, partial [Gammaproteobacteria bacterium]|nr:DUF429 domain-containing protein [Gammaproteobacteria bacterium]